MKPVAVPVLLAAVAAALTSCQSNNQASAPYAYGDGNEAATNENPYGEGSYPSPYGAPPGPYPQEGDYVEVTPVAPDPYAGSTPPPAETYQPPSYGDRPAAPAPPVLAANTNTTHQVAKGDTLYSISRRYGTSVEAIKQVNSLNSDTIYAGDTLAIP